MQRHCFVKTKLGRKRIEGKLENLDDFQHIIQSSSSNSKNGLPAPCIQHVPPNDTV